MFDAHAHLTSEENVDVTPLLERASAAGVKGVINVCCDLEDLQRGICLAKSKQPLKIYTSAALTPHEATKDDAEFFKEIERLALAKELVAIGETGLDYHYNYAPRDVQIEVLKRYLQLANSVNLPVVIHCREAFDDLCKIIDETCPHIKVMLHCFTGTLEEAKRAVERGWYVSLSGIVTFAKSIELQKVALFIPKNLLLIETDSPYLAPQGFRGKKNEPAYLVHTALFVANLRNESIDALAQSSTQNVQRLFNVIS